MFQHQRKWLDWREINAERLLRDECCKEESMRYLRDWRAAAAGTAGAVRRSSPPEHLRAGMRDRLLVSPLMDHVGFTRALESCYLNLVAERKPSAIGS